MKRRRTATNRTNVRKQEREVRDDLRRRLRLGRTALRRVRCDFVESTAVLWGSVCCEEDRLQAEKIVLAQPRVECVENRIMVEPLQHQEAGNEGTLVLA